MMTNEDLIAKLAQRLEWTETAVSQSLDAVISALKAELAENNPVIIDGFGKFSTHKQSEYILRDRETNERYLMPPAVEVVFESLTEKTEEESSTFNLFFTPDEVLNKSVNSPFTNFEPTLLNEGVEFPGIQEVIAGEDEEVEPGKPGEVETAEISEETRTSAPTEISDESAEILPDEVSASESLDFPEIIPAGKPVTPHISDTPCVRDDRYRRPDHKRTKRKKTSAVWIPIMGGVAIALAGLFFFRGWQPGKGETTDAYQPGPEAERLIIPQSDTTLRTVADTTTRYGTSLAEGGEINASLQETKKVRLGEGKTLRLLALDLFGNREFWVYIYLENKSRIKNPNRIPAGTELRIPDASRYGINADDLQSVMRAKKVGERSLEGL